MSPPLETCPACGGEVCLQGGAGRLRHYRDAVLELPAEMLIPTCQLCGETWVDGVLVDRIDAALAQRYRHP